MSGLSEDTLKDFPYLAVVEKMPVSLFRKVRALLRVHEGFRANPYTDTVGKMTIGYGRNLVDNGLSATEALFLEDNDSSYHYQKLREYIVDWDNLDEARQTALITLSYNLGFAQFKKFEKMIEAINERDFKKASDELMDSKWAKQVGKRAQDLVDILETGEFTIGG